jgi:carbonic anhydrase/acetyltransferase-like protein (isoleucine patch superfamily)
VPIYALGDLEPDIHPDAYVHPDAVVIGGVRLGAGSSVWPTAVLRGDDGRIVVGELTSVQDGTIVHTTAVQDTIIGNRCVIGHNAHIEASTIGDDVLIASGSVVLNGSRIDDGALVAAGAVVSPNMHVPARNMAVGVPARVREGYLVPEGRYEYAVRSYLQRGRRFRAELRRLDQR